jgi:hypothetical protein
LNLQNQCQAGADDRAQLEVLGGRRKPFGAGLDAIRVERDVVNGELAGCVACCGAVESGGSVGKVNGCVGNHSAGGIGDGAMHRGCIAALAGVRCESREKQYGEGKRAANLTATKRHGKVS